MLSIAFDHMPYRPTLHCKEIAQTVLRDYSRHGHIIISPVSLSVKTMKPSMFNVQCSILLDYLVSRQGMYKNTKKHLYKGQ